MSFKRIITEDKNIQLIQDNIAAALSPIESQPMIGGAVINNISLASGQDNLIAHTLGRMPAIFFIGNLNADTAVWTQSTASLSNQSSNSTFINLRCSTNCTVSLWVN